MPSVEDGPEPLIRHEADHTVYRGRDAKIWCALPGCEAFDTEARPFGPDPAKCPVKNERRWPCHFDKGHTTGHAFTDAQEMAILREELTTVQERVEKILALHQPEDVFDPEAQETITICGACQEITGGDICTTTQILRGEA